MNGHNLNDYDSFKLEKLKIFIGNKNIIKDIYTV